MIDESKGEKNSLRCVIRTFETEMCWKYQGGEIAFPKRIRRKYQCLANQHNIYQLARLSEARKRRGGGLFFPYLINKNISEIDADLRQECSEDLDKNSWEITRIWSSFISLYIHEKMYLIIPVMLVRISWQFFFFCFLTKQLVS